MLQVDVSVQASASGFGYSGSFSASTSYKRSVKEVTKEEATTVDIVGRANVYKARLSSTGTISKLSEEFEDSIRALPIERCKEDVIQRLYVKVIEEFGTHYATEVVMGAKAVQELRFKNSDLDRFKSLGVSVKVAAEMSFRLGVFSGDAAFSVGVTSNEELREMLSKTEKEQREYYIGGRPPSVDYSAGSTEALREWARSAAENPAPIRYKLVSIDAIIRPEYFKKKILGLYEKKQCFRKALFSHCTSMIPAYHCSLRSESSADGYPGTFKYGDFIKIRNGHRYLALSQHYGISPGVTMKPLTTVSEITNYDGLFRLVPPDGFSDKLGLTIHYGEPFLLKTIKGDKLHIGRSIILNTDKPVETRLLDLFNDQDETMNVNISHSPITDYSVFLKKEHACSYLITIRSHCYNGKVKHYQIEMVGSKGTTSNTVVVGNIDECLCPGRNPCGSYWFHTLVVNQDIGGIHTVRITGKYGVSTDGIWELKVKSIINGEKRQVAWDWDHARGRVHEIKNSLKKWTRKIDLDVYPVQFTFLSSNIANLEGQPLQIGDTGFIHILSSVPRMSFWDQPLTHVVSLEDMDEVGVKEIGPKPHMPLSAVCDDLIYPSAANISQRYENPDGTCISVSFDVKVRILYVEIETESIINFSIAYLNESNKTFMQIPNVERTQTSNTQNFTSKSPLYTTAIKIRTMDKKDKMNIANLIKMILVVGCPSAILDTGMPDTVTEEWTIELSDNVIRTNPYLHVIPRYKTTVDPVALFEEIERPLSQSFSLKFPLLENQYDCDFPLESLQNRLQENTAEVKYGIMNISKNNTNDGQELWISIDITSTIKEDYDHALTLLNSTIISAIKDHTCSGNTRHISSSQTDTCDSSSQSSASFGPLSIRWIIIGASIVLTSLFHEDQFL